MNNRFLLVAVNAKFIHSNLAIRYIKGFCENINIDITLKEFSINDSFNSILKEIYKSECNIIAFSCYIWNIELVLKLCHSIKLVKPDCTIILGGPEASFEIEQLLNENPSVDYLILGEGEATFKELAMLIKDSRDNIHDIAGIAYRYESEIIVSKNRAQIEPLDLIPFPYKAIDELENKIIYYETSRGCPFNCQYCLSSTIKGVRFFSLDRVKSDIDFFIDNNVKQVKLVDRTFNCNKTHCLSIMEYIIDKNAKTNFHFEIAADLIDDEFLTTVKKAPPGMFQFEIGVQTTNQNSLNEIKRKMNFDKVQKNVRKLIEIGNAHIHLDLIAGLPFEDYLSFSKSFDDVYALSPDMLQLGFLKLLKGSGIRRRAAEYNVKYNNHSPYEVLSTNWLSYEELLELKNIEELIEIYYNSGRFYNSLKHFVSKHNSSPFILFQNLSDYWESKHYFDAPRSLSDIYKTLLEFSNLSIAKGIAVNELIKLDWLLNAGSTNMPDIIKRYDHSTIKHHIHDFLKNNKDFENYLAKYPHINSKNVLKAVYYEVFFTDVLSNPENDKLNILFFIKDIESKKVEAISYDLKIILGKA